MADVRPRTGGRAAGTDSERGQLILVGGIVVAFALVALVLLLNTVLFAENVATRDVERGVERAGDHAAFAERAGRGIIRHEEMIEYDQWSSVSDNVTNAVNHTENITRTRQFQRYGAYTSIETASLRRGAALTQTNVTRNFTNESTNGPVSANWTLANTTGVRNFTTTVNRSRTDDVSAEQAFNVTVTGDGGNNWTAAVTANASGVYLYTPSTVCTSTADNATIDWTDGSFDGCAFTFAEGLTGPYRLRFENGDRAAGTYHLVVSNETSADDVRTGNFAESAASDDPRAYPAVYSLVLDVGYEGEAIDHETHPRIAPGEPPETSPA